MTAAYLDPFSQIVGLEKPANQSAMLIHEIHTGTFTAEAPPPGYTDANTLRWDIDVRVYLIPKISTLTLAQRQAFRAGVFYRPQPGLGVFDPGGGPGWVADAGTISPVYATPELALAARTGIDVGSIIRGPSVGPGVLSSYTAIDAGPLNGYKTVSGSGLGLFQDALSPVGVSAFSWDDGWTNPTFSSALLTGIRVRSEFGPNGFAALGENVALIRVNCYTEYTIITGVTSLPCDLMTSTTDVPAAISGQTQFNSQRAANLAYVGTVSYP